jgi:hypothetical protein
VSLVLISKELSFSHLSHPTGVVLDFSKTDECIIYLRSRKEKSISIYDITQNKKRSDKSIISVNDHINSTGSNPLIGRQKKLAIDFIDMTSIYQQTENGVVSHSCGKILDFQFDYPSHFLSHIAIIARALNFQAINAYLINHQS